MSSPAAHSQPLSISVHRNNTDGQPEHHIVESAHGGWSSYLPGWNPTPGKTRSRHGQHKSATHEPELSESGITGFRNPWPSWHKPSGWELWQGLGWGADSDTGIKLAASHVNKNEKSEDVQKSGLRGFDDWPKHTKKIADTLLHIEKPDFEFDRTPELAKATWLGHAGILVQLPSSDPDGEPIRCLFDPIFSMRCSPSQAAGPIRSYVPPCEPKDLPAIDLLLISHNHYDHLDYDTIRAVWKLNRDNIRFIVPLGNQQWFVECGIPAERVTELDWWESVTLRRTPDSPSLKFTCTPAQHSSGRGLDTNASLWASWYLEHQRPSKKAARIFFAGDTGYQFHDSPSWPPPPPKDLDLSKPRPPLEQDDKFPACPAFEEIVTKLGSPHLLFIPIAVGATWDFVRSWVPVPDTVQPLPRINQGLTAHTHMPPWDAVRVLKLMTKNADPGQKPPVAVAMHWGTFVTDPADVLKTLGDLEWACYAHDVQFSRRLEKDRKKANFVALNHGESVAL